MLRIAIEEIPEGISFLELSCEPKEVELEADGFLFVSPVAIKLEFFRQQSKIFVKTAMSVNVEAECSRCLDDVYMKLDTTSQIQYRPLPKLERDRIEDIGIGYYSDEYINLTDEVRECLLLELPMMVLCSEDCRGLCPHCGKNNNLGKCNCIEEENTHFSRLADVLKVLDIKKKLEV